MKKVILLSLLLFSMAQVWAQGETELVEIRQKQSDENRNFRIPLIGEKVPSFIAESTNGIIHFPSDFGRNWKILFSHPADFTPVCSSEILELANLQNEFDKLGVKLVVISADPVETHKQWKKALEQIEYKGRAPVKIKFPLVDDEFLIVSKMYGMIHAATNTTRDVRGVYVIDPDNVLRIIYFYPMEIGRSTEELIRTVTALQVTAKDKVATPADWHAGNDVIVPYHPNQETEGAILNTTMPEKYYQVAWFMWYKKLDDK